MNLTGEQRRVLNSMLASKALDLPKYRRYVSDSGTNYQWLRRNILIRNPDISDTLKKLLLLKK